MGLRPARLRRGELLAGAGALALIVLMVGVHWYGARTGWQVLTSARWLVVVTVAAALVLVASQATRPSPALPVTMSVITTVLGLLTVLWLLYRVAVSPGAHQHVGSCLGLLSACMILVGAFWSMRQEGISPEDEPREIVTVKLRAGPAVQR
jgi:hypothetical protein